MSSLACILVIVFSSFYPWRIAIHFSATTYVQDKIKQKLKYIEFSESRISFSVIKCFIFSFQFFVLIELLVHIASSFLDVDDQLIDLQQVAK